MTDVLAKPLISFTPLIQTPEHNLIRISRTHSIDDDGVHLVAGGLNKGIIINRLTPNFEKLENFLPWKFSVWLGNGKQEVRSFKFSFYDDISALSVQSEVSQQFIKNLFTIFPKDYASFFKLVLRLMQGGFPELRAIDVDMKFAEEEEAIPMPNAKEYENDAEIENVTIGHIQDVLEHAFPNGLSVDMIAESLRCSEEEVETYLVELQRLRIVKLVPDQNEWIRVDTFSVPESNYRVQSKHHPTVAIITCLFVEKQSVDAIIENSSTLHKYSKAGDSNVYTLGYIGDHHVVATKLAMIGDSREATTSAGSITTRLLGSFQYVEHVLIVGVGGGVPHFTDSAQHVRLGDVVISHAADGEPDGAAYVYANNFTVDRKTEQVNGFSTNKWRPKSNAFADVIKQQNDGMIQEWRKTVDDLIDTLNKTSTGNEFDFSRPPSESDVLTMQIGTDNIVVFPHPNAERCTPAVHLGSVGAMISLRRPTTATQAGAPAVPPKEHSAALTNGNGLTANDGKATAELETWLSTSSRLRDKFVAENRLRAFDAGFNSVIAAVNGSRIDSWALVRGIADYQQGSTRLGKQWQPYASVNAAALVKTILRHIPAS